MGALLLEIRSEEIPARMQARAAEDLKRLVTQALTEAGLAWETATAHVTPRRLALAVTGLPAATPDLTEERRGPRADAPDKAVAGFLRATGLSRDQLTPRETPKGTFLFAVVHTPGRPAAEVLATRLPDALEALPWPKSMRWGTGRRRWVRPLHGLVVVLDGAVLPVSFPPLTAGDTTVGHRVHAPAPFRVTDFAGYEQQLRDRFVILDREERKALIQAGADRLAAAEGLRVRPDPGLLEEVAGLVEWPVPLLGRIDDAFMDLPPEVLATAMRAHQKYFAVETPEGALAPRFVTVANIAAPEGGAAVRTGNERVLRARLADARFFWDQDRQHTLAQRVPALAERVFHARLGSERDKVSRLAALAPRLAAWIPGAAPEEVTRAATLAKADLTTGMVGEFPELQGLMGGYYARHDGESPVVAEAIARHYAPQGPGDACPQAPVAVAVALADKLDTLFWFFAVDERPTGSKDPFALRRAALGVIRLILENGLRLPLRQALAACAEAGAAPLPEGPAPVIDALMSFFADRLKVHLREQGVAHDHIAAIFAQGDEDDLVRLLARVRALKDFLNTEDGANLLTAYRRAANIVRIEEKKDGCPVARIAAQAGPPPADQRLPEEEALEEALATASRTLATARAAEDHAGAMAALAGLRADVDAYFDRVTVNADHPALRGARLALLARIGATMESVAAFAHIEG